MSTRETLENGHQATGRHGDAAMPPADEKLRAAIHSAVAPLIQQAQLALRQELEHTTQQLMEEFQRSVATLEGGLFQRVRERVLGLAAQELGAATESALRDTVAAYSSSGNGHTKTLPIADAAHQQCNTTSNLESEGPYSDGKLPPLGSDGIQKAVAGEQPAGRDTLRASPVTATGPVPYNPASYWPNSEPLKFESTLESYPDTKEVENISPDFTSSEEDIYEGTVQLHVEHNEAVSQLTQFVSALRRSQQLRLLQLVGNRTGNVDLWIGLCEPLPLKQVLHQFEGVYRVEPVVAGEDDQGYRLLNVRLASQASPG